jgi:hypothetical protein
MAKSSDKKVEKKVKKPSKPVIKEPTKHAKPAASKDILAKANVTLNALSSVLRSFSFFQITKKAKPIPKKTPKKADSSSSEEASESESEGEKPKVANGNGKVSFLFIYVSVSY